jgi:hypothetical protein
MVKMKVFINCFCFATRMADIRWVSDTSLGVPVEVTNLPPQQSMVVNDLLTREIVECVRETSGLVDLDYAFFEKWRSRNGMPGFAVYGKRSGSNGVAHVASVKYRSINLADTADIPERFMTGPEPVRPILHYEIEVPASSPLVDPRSSNGPDGLHSLVDALSSNAEAIRSRIKMPESFYAQFDGLGELPDGPFDPAVREALAQQDPILGGGRYALVIARDPRSGSMQYRAGRVVGIGDGNFGGVSISDIDFPRNANGFPACDVAAIFGKGMERIYSVSNRLKS